MLKLLKTKQSELKNLLHLGILVLLIFGTFSMIPTVIGTEDNSTLISVPTCSTINEDLISVPQEDDETSSTDEEELVSIPENTEPVSKSVEDDALFSIPTPPTKEIEEADEDGLFSIPETNITNQSDSEDLIFLSDVGDPTVHCTINATDNILAADHWSCNNLSIEAGGILNMSTYNLTAAGDVWINGTLNGGLNNISAKSLAIADLGTYNATTNTTTVTAENAAGYAFDNDGTLTANTGILEIQTGVTTNLDIIGAVAGNVYDLIVNGGGNVILKSSPTIDNDVTVTATTLFDTEGVTATLTITGDVAVNGGTMGRSSISGARSFGSLTIASGATFVATSGTTTITSENADGDAFDNEGTFTHNNGIVNITTGTNTRLRFTVGTPLYNLEYAGGAITQVNGNTSVLNDLTISSGEYRTDSSSIGFNLTVIGDVTLDGELDVAQVATSEVALGSLTINSGGTYNATTGTTSLTGRSGSNYGILVSSGGMLTHNNGLVAVTNSVNQNVNININNQSFYDFEINRAAGTTYSLSSANASGLMVTNNLTVTDGAFKIQNQATGASRNITVDGDAAVSGGTLSTGGGNNQLGFGTFGSLTINSGTYNATSQTTTINAGTLTNSGTFTHNNGLVNFTYTGAGQAVTGGSYLYDAEFATGAQHYRFAAATTIANDLTVSSGTLKASNGVDTDYALTVTGDVDVTGTLDLNVFGTGAAASFGSLTIASGGTYDATSGTTTISNRNSANYGIQNAGTFTHNNGEVEFTFASAQWVDSGGNSFYDITYSSSSNLQLRTATKIDHNLTIDSGTVRNDDSSAGKDLTVIADVGISGALTSNAFAGATNNFGNLTILSGGTYTATAGLTNMSGNTSVIGTLVGSNGNFNASPYNISIASGGIVSNISQLNITLIENSGQLNISPGSEILFTDANAAGFTGSTGDLFVLGNSTDWVNITTASKAAPTNKWNAIVWLMDVTADYTTFSYYNYAYFYTEDIDNSILSHSTSAGIRLDALTSFTNNTIDNNGAAQAILLVTSHSGFDNITITNVAGNDIEVLNGVKAEFNNSNFDITNVDTTSTGIVTSSNHNDIASDFYVVMAQSDTVLSDEFTTDPGATDNLTLVIEPGGTAAGIFKLNGDSTYNTLNISATTDLDTDITNNRALTVTSDTTVSGNLTGQASAISSGSLTINSGGWYNATSGTTTLTDESAIGYAYNNDGTLTANSGTIDIAGTVATDVDFTGISGNVYDLTISTPSTFDVRYEGNTIIDNNLTINMGNAAGSYFYQKAAGDTLTVTGDVAVIKGRLLTGATGAMSFGSLTIASEGTYEATTGTTTISSRNGSAYGLGNYGTFTHNDGTVTFTMAGGNQLVDTGGDAFYNLICNVGAVRAIQIKSATTIDNDLTITQGTFDTTSAGNWALTVTGLTSVTGTLTANAATLSLGSGVTSDYAVTVNAGGTFTGGSGTHTIGSLTTANIATASCTLTSGTTTFDSEISVSDYVINLGQNSVFDDADGTVVFTGPSTRIRHYASTLQLYDVALNTANTLTQMGIVDIDNNLTITSGTLDTSALNYDLTVAQDTSITGTLTSRASAISFGNLTIEDDGKYVATTATTNITGTGNSSIIGNFSVSVGNVTNMRINGTQFNITKGINLELHDVTNEQADPPGASNGGKYVNISNTSATSSMLLNMSYVGWDPSNISKINLRKYNTSWHNITGVYVDTTNNWTSKNITRFSLFGMFIGNVVPSISNVTITPTIAYGGDDLNCTASNILDAEGDTLSYYYEWYNGGVLNLTSQNMSSNTHTLYSGNTSDGDGWKCVVIPHDGYSNGSSNSDSIIIQTRESGGAAASGSSGETGTARFREGTGTVLPEEVPAEEAPVEEIEVEEVVKKVFISQTLLNKLEVIMLQISNWIFIAAMFLMLMMLAFKPGREKPRKSRGSKILRDTLVTLILAVIFIPFIYLARNQVLTGFTTLQNIQTTGGIYYWVFAISIILLLILIGKFVAKRYKKL